MARREFDRFRDRIRRGKPEGDDVVGVLAQEIQEGGAGQRDPRLAAARQFVADVNRSQAALATITPENAAVRSRSAAATRGLAGTAGIKFDGLGRLPNVVSRLFNGQGAVLLDETMQVPSVDVLTVMAR